MKHDNRFFICKHCGNIIGMIHNAGVPVVCCGEPMHELVPNTTDAAQEKHVPVVQVQDGRVCVDVGEASHPMVDDHYIEWVYLETTHGGQRKGLAPGQKPQVEFALANDKARAVYAYCNKHGLWKTEL